MISSVVDIPFNVGGFVSQKSIKDLAASLNDFQKIMTALGSNRSSCHLTLCVLTSPAIPFIRITEKGYYRFRQNDYVGI